MTNPAILWGTRSINWLQLHQYGAGVVSQLKGLGINPGDRVAICSQTSPEYLIVLFALWRMRIVACPVSPRWPAAAVSEYLSRINAVLFLTTVPIRDSLKTVTVRTRVLSDMVCFSSGRDLSQEKAWQPGLEQEVTVIATSGSSGKPKAAVHTWANHYYSALGSQDILPLNSGDRWLLTLPLYHVAGIAIVVRCFLAGAAIVIAGDDLAQTVAARKVTHASLVTTQMQRLLQTPDGIAALKSLKYILLGGSAIHPVIVQKSIEEKLNVFISYGMSEMASQVATGPAGGCVKVLKHRQLKVDEGGEICLKGETLFKGYIQSGHVQQPSTPDGWFKSGDLGLLDDNGCLSVLGRKDNMFISGGENIHPEEIEKVLLSLEGVAQAVVVPKEDKEFGHRPVAFVERSPNASLTDEQIILHCALHLPRFKIPARFYPWPQEENQDLKLSRQKLAEKAYIM